MGTFTFKLPDIGEGIAEAEIVAWHVKVGDRIEEDGKIADVMTDKATVEMESPVSGTVIEVAGAEGDMIAIGSPLVVIEIEGDSAAEEAVAERIEAETPDAGDVARVEAAIAEEPTEPPPASVAAQQPKTEVAPEAPIAVSATAKVLASPAVRSRAKELGIDLAQVRPAEDGRLRHADLDAFLSYNAA